MTMTVVHLISGMSGGGAERFLLELCSVLSRSPAQRMIVVSLSSANTLEPELRKAGVEYYFLHINRWAEFPRGWRRMRALLTELQKTTASPMLLHAHMFHACMLGCVLRLFRPRLPLVFSLHNQHVEQSTRKILLWLCRPLRSVDILFPGTRRRWYQKQRFRHIGNGVSIRSYEHSAERDPVFTCLFLGRLEYQKDPLSLVELAAQLRGRYRFRILVAGEGTLFKPLQASIAEEGLQDYFELLGFVNDSSPLLARAHCLLLPSRWEGMPLALLEAAAAGVPVITTPVGNIPSFAGASNAFVGETQAFASLLSAVMDNYKEALIRAERLRQWVIENYNIDRVAGLHEALYREYARDLSKKR